MLVFVAHVQNFSILTSRHHWLVVLFPRFSSKSLLPPISRGQYDLQVVEHLSQCYGEKYENKIFSKMLKTYSFLSFLAIKADLDAPYIDAKDPCLLIPPF